MYQKASDIIHTLLRMPHAALIIQKIHNTLENEKHQRKEFYQTLTEQEKAEFINGEVIIHSPVVKVHNEVCSNVYRLLDAYVFKHDLGFVGIEKILIQLTRNDYEPDICYFNKNTSDLFTANQKFFPSPDLIVEVLSEGTAKRDRGIKFQDYEAHGVLEYWIVDPSHLTLEQYILKDNRYGLITKSNTGEINAVAVSGFSAPIHALFLRAENYKMVKKILG